MLRSCSEINYSGLMISQEMKRVFRFNLKLVGATTCNLYQTDCSDERTKDTAASLSLIIFHCSSYKNTLKVEISAGDKSRDILNLTRE